MKIMVENIHRSIKLTVDKQTETDCNHSCNQIDSELKCVHLLEGVTSQTARNTRASDVNGVNTQNLRIVCLWQTLFLSHLPSGAVQNNIVLLLQLLSSSASCSFLVELLEASPPLLGVYLFFIIVANSGSSLRRLVGRLPPSYTPRKLFPRGVVCWCTLEASFFLEIH